MRKIVFFDANQGDEDYFQRAFKNVHKYEVVFCEKPLDEASVEEYSDAAIVSVFVTSDVNARVIKQLPNLELIAARSTGFDHIDVEEANAHHALVATVPTYGEATVAEYTFMLILTLMRRLQESLTQLDEGVITYQDLIGHDLAGKTLGILGCGKIGRHVARIAEGFDMNVIGYDIHPEEFENISYVEFDEVIASSDILSLHLPSTKETHHILDEKRIAAAKPGVVIVNTARGDLIDSKALIDGLYSGSVGGAALDVIEGEELLRFDEEMALLHPDAKSHDLLLSAEHSILRRMPNVVLTPHNAFNSHEALERIRHTSAENIKQFLMHSPQNIVKPARQ